MITAEQLKDIQERADALYSYLNIEEKKVEFEEEQLRTQAPDFWDDVERAQEQMKKVKRHRKVAHWLQRSASFGRRIAALFRLFSRRNGF